MSKRDRRLAASKYQPARVGLLLVAEAPPDDEGRYFYFEDVSSHDDLFRYVTLGLFGTKPTRSDKAEFLERLRDNGVFLIDASEEPKGDRGLEVDLRDLVARCSALSPEWTILIKTNVYDQLHRPLSQVGLPVVEERIPFPTSGRQREFEAAFARALSRIGWENEGAAEEPVRSRNSTS